MGLFLHRRLAPPPLLLAILVAASSHGASSSADDGYDASMCVRQPYTCGGVSIKYPFYSRTGALLGSASSYCGYPGLEIQCEEGQAFLELQSGNYTISRIDYDDLTVRLVDPEVLDGRSCPRADHNVTFRNVSWLYYPSTTVDYLLFFINCNFLSDLSRPSSSNSTACKFDVGQASTGMSFVFLEQDVPYPNMNWWRSCSDVIEVPVLKSGLPSDSRNDPTWKNGGYGSSLRDGFQLALNQSQKLQACAQCEQSEGTCGHNQTGAFVACLCSDGRVGHPNCTTDSSGKDLEAFVGISGCFASVHRTVLLFLSLYRSPLFFGSRHLITFPFTSCSILFSRSPTKRLDSCARIPEVIISTPIKVISVRFQSLMEGKLDRIYMNF
jgi:hypothetical protein